ncbi:MAG: putative anti-sigma regulatory factor, serine/threonine protein kinase [Jatrophihabitans sp.]|jgi:serine/threonine-protein kinase RsbW|nr:putative anti-sigma regulatory factor, serine/threonine protein kinase [Jatrophihabitans sp.]MCW2655860.1 putative anti-sigma regulatory factor, serine/threonine protein kinase [Jatrophihabitans sp.]
MTTPDPARPDGDAVEVRIPADVVYVSTLRLTAASLAARCDLTIDDIEDLRLAVDEACALLLPHATPDSTLDARFELAEGKLAVDTSVTTSDNAEPDRDGFAWTVLGALASSVDVRRDDDRLTITVTKTREAAQQ